MQPIMEVLPQIEMEQETQMERESELQIEMEQEPEPQMEIHDAPKEVDAGVIVDSPFTLDGSLDWRDNPANKKTTGGKKLAALLLVNYGLATFAFFGLAVNLVLFLTRVMQHDNADAANNVSKWTGTVYMFSLLGALISDSYLGRYLTCAIFQTFFVMGLLLLSLVSWLFLVKPATCGQRGGYCNPTTVAGSALFYVSIYMIALGTGGYQPAVATFGCDQFDANDPREQRGKMAFFSFFYFALNFGSLFSNSVLVYFEDSGSWVIGFWTATAAAGFALVLFLAGSPWYRHFKPTGNPVTRIAQVFTATVKNWAVKVPEDPSLLYEIDDDKARKNRKMLPHTDELRWLDKAATMTNEDDEEDKPWRLCTVTQVEEAKRVMQMLPIWLCTIIYSVVFTQMASTFVEQGEAMNTALFGGRFNVPPASMSAFDILSVIFSIALYERVVAPLAKRLMGRRISELQRMAAGLVVGSLAMVAAGLVEHARLRKVARPSQKEPSELTIMWQVPQYAFVGMSEALMYVGQLKFFSGEAPAGVKSLGSSLQMASMAFGNYASSLLVAVVTNITSDGGRKTGWIPENLNEGHLGRWFFLLAGLTAADLVIYLLLASRYKYADYPADTTHRGSTEGTNRGVTEPEGDRELRVVQDTRRNVGDEVH